MKLVWSLAARQDRIAIREFIAIDNPSAVLDLDELLAERAARLLDHPHLGRDGRLKGTRELVRVLRVLHAAKQWPLAKK